MSLLDVDKSGNSRLNPKPNADDAISERMAYNTSSTTYKTDNDTSNQRMVFKNGMILTYDSDDKVSSVYGYVSGVSDTPIHIIAKDGYDVFEDILGLEAPLV